MIPTKKQWKQAAIITAVVFIAHYFSEFLEAMVVAGNQIAWLYLFIWYTIFIAFGLVLINKMRALK